MGEVYGARDTRLDRTVAIKILPAPLAADLEFRQRFDREARAISQLDHPNICTVYDVGEQDGTAFIVMQYLDGETLANRLQRGRLATDEALAIAIQVADALSRAHRAGIVHRDLKPGNVMLVESSTARHGSKQAKLLDFGLAKTTAPAVVASGLSALPTTPPAAITAKGAILGTFQYMAPEQLEGAEADARTDIFAFGCVLYEMLAGKPPFAGKSHASLISSIMSVAPAPLTAIAAVAPAVDHVIARCLAKDPDDRWQSIADVRAELTWIAGRAPASGDAAGVSTRRPRREAIAWTTTAVALVAVAALAVVATRRDAAPPPTSRLMMALAPADGLSGDVGVSHDGTRVAFQGLSGGKSHLYVRRLDEQNAAAIYGASVTSPAFSPDDRWIAFGEGSRLKKVPSTGGPVVDLTYGGRVGVFGIAWISADTIVFGANGGAEDRAEGIRKVSANGGESQPLTQLDLANGELSHLWPAAVPRGRWVLYASRRATSPDWALADIGIVSIETGRQRVLIRAGGEPVRVLPSGHLLVRRSGNVFAVPFDASRGEVRGSQLGVLEDVRYERQLGTGIIDVSDTGTVVYAEGLFSDQRRSLVFVGRDARTEAARLASNAYYDPRVSPDGQRVAVEVADASDDIWVADLRRGTMTRLTFDTEEDETPVWSPDGRWIAYSASRAGQPRTVFRKAADGSGAEEKLWTSKEHSHVEDWSRDGRSLIVSVDAADNKSDIWVVPLGGSDKAQPLIQTRFSESDARLSPDGRWIAYESNESERSEVYVQRFPALGSKAQVSSGGGAQPVWSRSGRELFYRGAGSLMVVPVTAGETIQFGAPKIIGEDVYTSKGVMHTGYDVTPDGRLLFARDQLQQANTKFLRVIENWIPELLRRVPGIP